MIERAGLGEAARRFIASTIAALRALKPESVAFGTFLALLLLLPQTLAPQGSGSTFGLARVTSGDEPHYMVMLSSAARDHDLDISNNYEWALYGSDDAGDRYRNLPLDRHMAAGVHGHTAMWSDYYTTKGWTKTSAGWSHLPRWNDKKPPKFRYSVHPDGLVVILAPVWLALSSSSLLEPAILFCSGLAAIAVMLVTRSLLQRFTDDRFVLRLALVATMLGTPLWHYGRALFTEIYLALATVATFALAFRARRSWLLGIPIACGLLFKSFFILLVFPAFFVLRRSLKGFVLACIPVGLAGAYVLTSNYRHFGDPRVFSQPVELFRWNPEAPPGLLFSTEHGLIPFAPIVVVALAGWVRLLREHTVEAAVMLTGVLTWTAVFCFVGFWGGGYCYGPRYLVPIMPILMLGLTKIRSTVFGRHPWGMAATAALLFLSIQINALGALPYWRFWGRHPLASLF